MIAERLWKTSTAQIVTIVAFLSNEVVCKKVASGGNEKSAFETSAKNLFFSCKWQKCLSNIPQRPIGSYLPLYL